MSTTTNCCGGTGIDFLTDGPCRTCASSSPPQPPMPPMPPPPDDDQEQVVVKDTAFIDWGDFWQRDRRDAEWLHADVLARGRGHAIYASHKTGKSLLALHLAAEVATGDTGSVVVYLDWEMGEDDLYERLEEMGYGPHTDLSRLHYALLPALPPLDTGEGAQALCRLLDAVRGRWPDRHLLVVLDTTSRAVAGAENDADTFRAFYACTGIELKRRGATWVRLDHAGKDPTRGQRGSSSKGDDVDVVWRLSRTANGLALHRELARMSWVPDKVVYAIRSDPHLTFARVKRDWPAGTYDAVQVLDDLGLDADVPTRVAQDALKQAGHGARRNVVVAACAWRRERADGPGTTPGTTFDE
jgi:KaiC/GvpD/RAD55 family RecA-like ATPase